MKNLIFNELRIFSRNYKVKLLVLVLITLGLVGTFAVDSLNIGNLEKAKKIEAQAVNGALKNISEKERLATPKSELANSLISLESLISKQQMALITENNQLYLAKEAEITDLQLSLIGQNKSLDLQSFFPPSFQLAGDKVINQYLVKETIPKNFNLLNGVSYTMFFSSLLLTFWSIFLFILYADILTEDFEHDTLLKGLPYLFSQRLWAKIWLQFLFMLLALFLAISGAFLTMSLRYSVGDVSYPYSIYFNHNYHAIPFRLYLPLVFIIIACLTLFILLFSVCLNLLTKNSYVTLFIQFSTYFLATLWPLSNKYLVFSPIPYLNAQAILTGETAVTAGLPSIDLLTGLLILCAWIILLSLVIHFVTANRKVAKT